MPSRKKNKGKERKAKKAELEAERIESIRALVHETWTGWARGVQDGRVISQCNHGCDLIPDDNNHPVTSFMDSFYTNGAVNDVGIISNLEYLFGAHREVWDNENYRQMAINIFIAVGTNFILQKDDASNIANISNMSKQHAHAIVILENYDSISIFSTLNSRAISSKLRDLSGSSRRVR